MAKAVTNSLPHRRPFFSVFKKWLCEVYRRFGTETSPVVSLNYLTYRQKLVAMFSLLRGFLWSSSSLFALNLKPTFSLERKHSMLRDVTHLAIYSWKDWAFEFAAG